MLVTAFSYICFCQEVTLNLIFLDFEILRVKVWVPTVITGKHRF